MKLIQSLILKGQENLPFERQIQRRNCIVILAYFPGVARVFIYLNLIVICVPSLADNFYASWRYITHLSADLHTVTSSY
jgi:hypothetical protein